MNKEQLIKLKKILSNQGQFIERYTEEYISIVRCGRYYLLENPQTFLKIQDELDTRKAVKTLMSNFENAIRYYCKERKEFDALTITPTICPYISKKSLDKYIIDNDFCKTETILKDDIEILDDIVKINFCRLFVQNNKEKISKVGENQLIPNYNVANWFVVSLKELKEELLEKGLELEGVEDIKDLFDWSVQKTITIDFEKNEAKTKLLRKVI